MNSFETASPGDAAHVSVPGDAPRVSVPGDAPRVSGRGGRRVPRSRGTDAAPWVLAVVAAAGVGVVAAVDPSEPGHYPLCPFHAITGLYCPGCGALRATHALAHGDLGAALGFNTLYVLALPCLAVVWVMWVLRSRTGARPGRGAPMWLFWVLLGVVAGFAVLRNLPGFEALAP